MFVPRSRTYREAVMPLMWNVMVRNAELSTGEFTLVHAEAPLPLKVRRIAAVRFLAGSGTAERSAVVPSAFNQLVWRGHSPAYCAEPGALYPVTVPPMRSM